MSQNKNKKSIVTPTSSGNQKKKESGGGGEAMCQMKLMCKCSWAFLSFRVCLGSAFCASQHVYVSPFFFLVEKFDFSTYFQSHVGPVHCSQTHKFHFSTTFSLKMDPTVLFTYLKIIFLQYFSVFNFSFQLYSNGPLLISTRLGNVKMIQLKLLTFFGIFNDTVWSICNKYINFSVAY